MSPQFAIMIVSIVLIAMVGRVMQERYRAHGRPPSSADLRDDGREARRAEDEIRQLKDRVAVLERVITDNHKSVDLDREIDRLRDR